MRVDAKTALPPVRLAAGAPSAPRLTEEEQTILSRLKDVRQQAGRPSPMLTGITEEAKRRGREMVGAELQRLMSQVRQITGMLDPKSAAAVAARAAKQIAAVAKQLAALSQKERNGAAPQTQPDPALEQVKARMADKRAEVEQALKAAEQDALAEARKAEDAAEAAGDTFGAAEDGVPAESGQLESLFAPADGAEEEGGQPTGGAPRSAYDHIMTKSVRDLMRETIGTIAYLKGLVIRQAEREADARPAGHRADLDEFGRLIEEIEDAARDIDPQLRVPIHLGGGLNLSI